MPDAGRAHDGHLALGREAHGLQEDAIQVGGRDADPGVAHLDAQLARESEGFEADGRSRRGRLGGIIEQIAQRPGHQPFIGVETEVLDPFWQLEGHGALCSQTKSVGLGKPWHDRDGLPFGFQLFGGPGVMIQPLLK